MQNNLMNVFLCTCWRLWSPPCVSRLADVLEGFSWEKWSCFFTKDYIFTVFMHFYICLTVWKRCNIDALVWSKLSQESCGLPEWFLSEIVFLITWVILKGKIKCGSDCKKWITWTMKAILTPWFLILWCCCLWSILFSVALAWLCHQIRV